MFPTGTGISTKTSDLGVTGSLELLDVRRFKSTLFLLLEKFELLVLFPRLLRDRALFSKIIL